MIIFSSNQKFEFSGSVHDKESIKILSELIVQGIRPYGWRYVDGNLFFDCHMNSLNTAIDNGDENVEYIASVISLYLNSSIYKDALKKVSDINGDGSCEKGWVATYMTKSYEDKGMMIKPFKCFYHK